MDMDPTRTIHRLDYTPPSWLAERIGLEFELDPRRTVVTATTRYRRNPAAGAGPLVLDGESLELLEIAVDGTPLRDGEYDCGPAQLSVTRALPEEFELRVVTAIAPEANTALMGLYVSNGNFFTQCEAEGFRRITWFQDRPDVMARYRVTLRADRERFPVLLSNGNLVDQGDIPAAADGAARHYAVWDDPFPKPSYLFAVVAGRLAATERSLKTRSGREVLLQVWVEPGNEDRTGHAMQSLVEAIRWDEERFGLELDLDRFMIVAVGDFNMGAMENKGLNVFNTKYVFATPRLATDVDFANVESVVGHEYFHNWTGNRVTCRDWFQLTLKEGLTVFRDQEFSADRMAAESDSPAAAASARAVKRIEDVRLLRAAQFPEDAGPMAHPIRPDAYQEINNFYTVTVYEKGAEVIRMLQTLVGRDGFRRGMDLYFQRHDGQAVTCDDFVAAVADANGRDLAQFSRWYAQAGTPRLAITGRHDPAARSFTLEVAQASPPDASGRMPVLHVPLAVGLLDAQGRDLPLRLAGTPTAQAAPEGSAAQAPGTLVLELTGQRQSFVFVDVDAPVVPSLLRDFSAPVIVDYRYEDRELAFLAAHDSDPFNRWEATQRLAVGAVLRTLDGDDPARAASTLVEALRRSLGDETLDPAFRELVLTLPGEGVIAEQLAVVDPARLRAVRDALRMRLASELEADWRGAFARMGDQGPWRADRTAAARRALKNVALGYWVLAGAAEAREAAATQFASADNMTDRQAALQALVSGAAPQRDAALAAFATEFGDEPLAMDKWLTIQATMHRAPGEPPVLERVRALMSHPAFSIRNPNRVRALVGSFCSGNLAEFHATDGSGYAFWAEQVAALDALNPQVAARIARALDRWRKFTPERQAAMRSALETLAGREGLSGDVREIVGKALAA
ncbi:aminopeptidase N [Quisquiliibacterium transsilvanicum]|uniref:Aminopeptidase N n=1 Tax=Quisquiliibacterium transsilvanicum TaxID=1549638 RepID=A0A7W8HLY4_9BURK|nr:aminopeptidase N [Quisquiliibacterium transsilvanicum]MBB5273533.1 aminopeptidase N [Quisquiliibacterium transsilvanicum]